jgi:hypothetical protein
MGTGSSRVDSSPTPNPTPMGSSPSECSLCSEKRHHVWFSESPSNSQGSIVTTFLGTTVSDDFHGRSNTTYKKWMEEIQSTPDTDENTSFINKKVSTEEDGVWTIGKDQCPYQDIISSRTCMLPSNSILTNKSQSFSIVWTDDTSSSDRHSSCFIVTDTDLSTLSST